MAEPELLEMLAAESDRRVPAVISGVRSLADSPDPDPAAVEELRVEVHGLKGAAMVIGQSRLAELASLAERALATRADPGTIDPELAGRLTSAVKAFHAGIHAAADGGPEPPAVGESLGDLEEH